MRKIINGKSYDTDTAKEIYEFYDEHPTSIWSWRWTTLYKKRTGEYFFELQNSIDHCIRPVSLKEAMDWCETHMSTEEYEAEFGAVSEGDAVISTAVSAAAKSKLERTAQEKGISQRKALEMFLAQDI